MLCFHEEWAGSSQRCATVCAQMRGVGGAHDYLHSLSLYTSPVQILFWVYCFLGRSFSKMGWDVYSASRWPTPSGFVPWSVSERGEGSEKCWTEKQSILYCFAVTVSNSGASLLIISMFKALSHYTSRTGNISLSGRARVYHEQGRGLIFSTQLPKTLQSDVKFLSSCENWCMLTQSTRLKDTYFFLGTSLDSVPI